MKILLRLPQPLSTSIRVFESKDHQHGAEGGKIVSNLRWTITSKNCKAGCLDVSVNGGRRASTLLKDSLQNKTLKNHEEIIEITFLISLWERIKYLLKKMGNCLLKKCEKDCQTRP